MRKWKKEIGMVNKYNEVHGTNYEIVINDFEDTFLITDKYGNKISSEVMNEMWNYYGQ